MGSTVEVYGGRKKNMNKNNTNNNKIHNKNSQKYCRACGRPIGKGPGFCSSPSYY